MAAPTRTALVKAWLRAVPAFTVLSEEELDALVSSSRTLTVQKGVRLFEEGSPADSCYVLVSGSARLALAVDRGAEIIVGVVKPMELVGEVALLDGCVRSADLVATEECHFLRIPAESFERLRTNHEFERRMVAEAVRRLRNANDQVRGRSSTRSTERLAWCLVRLAQREGTRHGTMMVIPKRPHQQLGEMTGLARETVTRLLAALKRRNCITWDEETMSIDLDEMQHVLRRDVPSQ